MAVINDITSKAGYFSFILSSFGLRMVKPYVFDKGKVNDANPSPGDMQFTHTDRGQLNMHTGADGKPPMSVLGTPVFADLKLSLTKKEDFAYNIDEDVTESVHLLWVLCEVNQQKNIVKTKVQGRDGSVKEYISDDDYMVTLRGAFVDTFKDSYPKDAVKKLIKLCKAKVALKVTSEYLLMFGIHELVIEGYSFSQEEGKQNIQRFQLTCSSDVPLILKKKRSVRNK